MESNKKYNGIIDLIKFCAALIIVLHHYQLCTPLRFADINFTVDDPFFCGANMVEMFFVISGFLSVKDIEKTHTDRNMFTTFGINRREIDNYLKDRFKKFVPWTLGSTILSTISKSIYIICTREVPFGKIGLWNLIIGSIGLNAGLISSSYEYLPNETLWYISVLLICNIFCYFLIELIDKYQLPAYYVGVIMCMIGLSIKYFSINIPILNSITMRGFISFGMGIITKSFLNFINMKKGKKVAIGISIIFIGIVIMYYYFHSLFNKGQISQIFQEVILGESQLLWGCMFAPLIVFVVGYWNKFGDGLHVLKILGRGSFYLYIWHLPFIYFIKVIMMGNEIINEKYYLIIGYLLVVICSLIVGKIYNILLSNGLKGIKKYEL